MRYFFFVFFFISSSFANSGSSFWWQMALQYKEEGNRVLEKMAIEKVLQLDPFHEQALKMAHKITGMGLEQTTAWEREQKERISNLLKEEKLQLSLQLQTGSPVQEQLDYEQRIDLMEKQLLSEEISDAQKTQIKKELGQLYYHVGLRSHEEEKVHQAINAFEKAVFYDSEFQLSYYELGFLYFKVRELERGINNLEKFYNLQSFGTLARFVQETLLNKYILIARRYYFQRDFEKCKPILEKIQRFDAGSPEAKTALIYLMELYYYQGNQFLELSDYFSAGSSFYSALEVLKSLPEVDNAFFVRLAKNAVQPFIRTGQKLFIDNSFGEAYQYFEAVTLMVPGTSESFMAREYMKEIERQTGQAENPVVYFNNFVQEESNRFLLEEKRRKYLGGEEKF